MNKIKLNVYFNLIEDIKKQEELFKITNEETIPVEEEI